MISRAPRIPKIGTFSEPRHLISNPPANPFPSPRGPGFALSRGAVFMSPATSLWTRSPALQACFSRPPASGFSRHARFFLPSRTSADPTDVLFPFYLYIQLDRIKNKCLIRHPCPHSANRKQLFRVSLSVCAFARLLLCQFMCFRVYVFVCVYV